MGNQRKVTQDEIGLSVDANDIELHDKQLAFEVNPNDRVGKEKEFGKGESKS